MEKNFFEKKIDGVIYFDKMDNQNCNSSSPTPTPEPDRLKLLYPNVDEQKTKLPRTWSALEKCSTIGLTLNNLRVHYKGLCKNSLSLL
jgi:hypothetical protein